MRMLERLLANRFLQRAGWKSGFALAMALCLAWNAAQALRPAAADAMPQAGPGSPREWPREWNGAPLRPLALGAVEQRFARRFPGTLTRLTDGTQVLVMREVRQPTRMLHPAADCYRALGWRIAQIRLARDAQERLWRCFLASRPGAGPLRVCERIEDAKGDAFTDTSAWYWAAVGGRTQGPWRAVTVATPL